MWNMELYKSGEAVEDTADQAKQEAKMEKTIQKLQKNIRSLSESQQALQEHCSWWHPDCLAGSYCWSGLPWQALGSSGCLRPSPGPSLRYFRAYLPPAPPRRPA